LTERQFIQSIETHQGIIHKVCNLYMGPGHDREDLFQEILLSAWKGIHNFKGDALFSTWLYRVALNTAITFYRKERRQVATAPWPSALVLPDNTSDSRSGEEFDALYQAIGELSAIDKALVMLYLEEYSYAEISDIMGITANNVAVKMNRIKTRLRENSKKYFERE
jgi:RNA polymerase sigma factor (sigma-70 family)